MTAGRSPAFGFLRGVGKRVLINSEAPLERMLLACRRKISAMLFFTRKSWPAQWITTEGSIEGRNVGTLVAAGPRPTRTKRRDSRSVRGGNNWMAVTPASSVLVNRLCMHSQGAADLRRLLGPKVTSWPSLHLLDASCGYFQRFHENGTKGPVVRCLSRAKLMCWGTCRR